MTYDPNEVKSIFLQAAELSSPSERASFLERVCADRPETKARVESLLRTLDDPDSLLDQPVGEFVDTQQDLSADRSDGSSQVALDFLEPCDVPGRLGKLSGYEVLEMIGRGGMGIVLRALDVRLNRVVAMKVLSPELAASPQARQRFLREAQAAAAVSHAHVVTIYAVDDDVQLPFLVMECIGGQSLQQKIDRQGTFSIAEILRIGMQTAAGLAAAHAQGLVHRDIKPANILLENGVERVKLTDFGLARAVDDASVTQSGVIAGTPLYMSPEQARGESIDHRSDLFSLGSVLYAMCVGHAPFRASTTMGVIKRVCDESPRPIREMNTDVPDWLAQIIDKLLAKRPEDRFQTAKEVAELLGQCLAYLQQPQTVPLPGGLASGAASLNPIAARPEVDVSEMNFPRRMLTWPLLGVYAILLIVAAIGEMRWQELLVVSCVVGLWVLFVRWILSATIAERRARALAAAKTSSPPQNLGARVENWRVRPHGDPRRRVAHAALALVVVGLVNWLTIFVILAWLYTNKVPAEFEPVAFRVFAILAIGSGVILFGAYRMVNLDSYRWAMTSAICSMFIGPGYIVGWPCGLWALAVLARQDVRDEFQLRHKSAKVQRNLRPPFIPRWWKLTLAATLIAFCAWRMSPSLLLMARDRGSLSLSLHDPQATMVLRRDGEIVAEYAPSKNRWPTVRPIRGGGARFVADKAPTTFELAPGRYQVEVVPPLGRAVNHLYYSHGTLFTNRYAPQSGATEKEVQIGRGDVVTLFATFKNSTPLSHPDVQQLQGRWMVLFQEAAGKSRLTGSGSQPVSLVFDGEHVRQIETHDFPPYVQIVEDSYVINPHQTPKEIDLSLGGQGIYQLEGDTLTLCLASPSPHRPKAFDSHSAAESTLTALKRAEPDDERIQGRWQVVSQERGSNAMDAKLLPEWIEFAHDRLRIKFRGAEATTEQLFELNPAATARQIDLFGTQDRNHEGTGIYQLEGDSLTLCIGQADRGRPTKFSSLDASPDLALTVLKREQPADAVPAIAPD